MYFGSKMAGSKGGRCKYVTKGPVTFSLLGVKAYLSQSQGWAFDTLSQIQKSWFWGDWKLDSMQTNTLRQAKDDFPSSKCPCELWNSLVNEPFVSLWCQSQSPHTRWQCFLKLDLLVGWESSCMCKIGSEQASIFTCDCTLQSIPGMSNWNFEDLVWFAR